jgi:LysM repeat protein
MWQDSRPSAGRRRATREVRVTVLARRARGLWLPLAAAALVLASAAVAGYGLSQVVAQLASAPGPRTTLAPATATPSPSPVPTPTASPSQAPSATAAPTASPTIHVVARGEYLALIAERYGVTVEAIIAANDLFDPDHIEVGQKLIIPAPTASPSPSR